VGESRRRHDDQKPSQDKKSGRGVTDDRGPGKCAKHTIEGAISKREKKRKIFLNDPTIRSEAEKTGRVRNGK